jgi:hypothetical protein
MWGIEDKMMDMESAVKKLNAMDNGDDQEIAHCEAENVLTEYLREIGHEAIADAFEAARDRVGFWYA